MARTNFQKHARADKVKWVVTLIAFVLLFAAVAALLASLFVGDGWLTQKKYRFEAEAAELGGSAVANEGDDDRGFVGEFSEGSTVTFHVTSEKKTDAELRLCITLPEAEKNLTDLVKITVNGDSFTTEDVIVTSGAADKRWTTWVVVNAGKIHLNEGSNELKFEGTFGGCNFDYITLSAPRGISLKLEKTV